MKRIGLVLLVVALALSCARVTARSLDDDYSVARLVTPASSFLETHHSTRHEDPLDSPLADRASLLFRALDRDSDRSISQQDVQNSETRLRTHMPGVTVSEFMSFIEAADLNGDHKLSRDELLNGLADGMVEARTLPAHLLHPSMQGAALLETEAQRRERGGVSAMAGVAARRSAAAMKVTGAVDVSQDGCVMCQYITERCEANVKQSGVIPGLSSHVAFDSFLETESQLEPVSALPPLSPEAEADAASAAEESLVVNTVAYAVNSMDDNSAIPPVDAVADTSASDYTALLEADSTAAATQFFDHSAAGIIADTRQTTRVQRQLERQKYNEIYRVVDISLDDVCEQGMPNAFYGFCKQIYKLQTDVVDGLRYQYRPADICFRIGMCGKGSYITKGIHTRYK